MRLLYRIALPIASIAFPLRTAAQGWLPSPLQWLYPRANLEATQTQLTPSAPQSLDSFRIKWREPAISGEGAVLVGPVFAQDKLLPELPWAPNNIVTVHGDTLYVLSGGGWLQARLPLPPFLWDLSALLDTLAPLPRSYSPNPTLIAFQSAEHRTPDSLASTYVVASQTPDSLRLFRRLTVDMRPYTPNLAAALIPIATRSTATQTLFYAIVHTTRPHDTSASPSPYFRGLTQFVSDSLLPDFPTAYLPDIPAARTLYSPSLLSTQPSLTTLPGGIVRLLLPLQPDSASATVIVNRLGHRTRADSAYLVGLDLQSNLPSTGIAPTPLPIDSTAVRPSIFPLWVRLQPSASGGERPYILIAEGYDRLNSSGTARLHLHDATGLPAASPLLPTSPAFTGSRNHGWSIAVGNFDGPPSNSVPPFYPNNPGAEIAVCPNTPSRNVAPSRLFLLRYRTDYAVPKPYPPNTFLFPLDTIVSAPCSGWIAAAADLDGDGRDELLLVDQGTLQIWRLRDYSNPRFSLGAPFDTVWSLTLQGERITTVTVADGEGDGRADLFVRTTQALYCIGVPLPPRFLILTPRQDTTLCVHDTLHLRWVNPVRGYSPVRILFQPSSGSPPRPLWEAYPNDTDTVHIAIPVRLLLPDTAGRLLLQSLTTATPHDSTPLLTLRLPSLTLLSPTVAETLSVGTSVVFRGICSCTDTLILTTPDTTFSLRPDSTGTFSVTLPVPCSPQPGCTKELQPWTVLLSARADIFTTRIPYHFFRRPAPAPATLILSPTGICPEISASVDIARCPLPIVAYSTDGGASFTELPPPIPTATPHWLLPPLAHDTIWLRLCCTNGCYRIDTVVILRFPLTLHLLAPNPLQLPSQRLQIHYSFTTSGSARLRIMDAADNLVQELVPWRSHIPQTTYCETWDGTSSSGELVPTGTYYVVIEHQQNRWIFPVFVYWKYPQK